MGNIFGYPPVTLSYAMYGGDVAVHFPEGKRTVTFGGVEYDRFDADCVHLIGYGKVLACYVKQIQTEDDTLAYAVMSDWNAFFFVEGRSVQAFSTGMTGYLICAPDDKRPTICTMDLNTGKFTENTTLYNVARALRATVTTDGFGTVTHHFPCLYNNYEDHELPVITIFADACNSVVQLR